MLRSIFVLGLLFAGIHLAVFAVLVLPLRGLRRMGLNAEIANRDWRKCARRVLKQGGMMKAGAGELASHSLRHTNSLAYVVPRHQNILKSYKVASHRQANLGKAAVACLLLGIPLIGLLALAGATDGIVYKTQQQYDQALKVALEGAAEERRSQSPPYGMMAI